MNKVNLTCIECPMGCALTVALDDGKVIAVEGNTCARGKLYAENEVICPMRVVTTTVKTDKGFPVSVKTDKPVKKSKMFDVVEKINAVVVKTPVKIGDVVISDISDGANVVITMNID